MLEKINLALADHVAGKMLSTVGKRMYFPQGIVAQAEQSNSATIRATAGMVVRNSTPLILSAVQKEIPNMKSRDIVSYAPVAGIPELRDMWKEHIVLSNPNLNTKHITRPIVCSGLTHGINLVLTLFLEPNDIVITQNCLWENYQHIVETYKGGHLELCKMFDNQGRFLANSFQKVLRSVASRKRKIILSLNFPNNPTGLCLLKEDEELLLDCLIQEAERGIPIAVISDDAYFGLFYEDNCVPYSLFSRLASLHRNILAVKIDGATKEFLAWGLRVGFVTFGNPELNSDIQDALEQKVLGLIRATVTCGSRLSQSLVLKMLEDSNSKQELKKIFEVLKSKYILVKQELENIKPDFPSSPLTPLHFNGGYFMCFECGKISATALRLSLLNKEKIALIQVNNMLRFTFASVDDEKISLVIRKIYEHAHSIEEAAS